MPPKDSNSWPIDSISRVALLVQINDISLIGAGVTGIPESAYDPVEYDTQWRVFVFANGENLDDATREQPIAIDEGIDVIIDFEYTIKDDLSNEVEEEDRSDREHPLKLFVSGTFLLQYGRKSNIVSASLIKPSDISAFAKFNATVNAWPYWREFVQSMTSRMDIPTITVPLLPVPALNQ